MLKFAFLVLVVLAALVVIAIKFLPWWVSLLLIAVILLSLRYGLGYAIRRLLTLPFKAKGQVLSGAAVQVHEIRRAKPPVRKASNETDNDPEAAELLREERADDQRFNWYILDLTITPKQKQKQEGFLFWEPGELLFVGMDAQPASIEDDLDSKLNDYRILTDGKFQVDEQGKHQGAQRIKFHVGLPPAMQQIQLRYYFELFGQIRLPEATQMHPKQIAS